MSFINQAVYIHFYSLTFASCMSNSPFKNHKFLQSQALHNGLFHNLHFAYICMKKLQGKKQLRWFVFWSPNQKGDWIHFYWFIFTVSVKSLERNNFFLFSMWQINGLHHGLSMVNIMPGSSQVHQGHGSAQLMHRGNTRWSTRAHSPLPEYVTRLISVPSAVGHSRSGRHIPEKEVR